MFSSSRGISRRLKPLRGWIRPFQAAVLLWHCGSLAESYPPEELIGGLSRVQPESEAFLQQSSSNPSISHAEVKRVKPGRRLQIAFNNKENDHQLEQSQEEVVYCEMDLIADFPMGLVGEAALLLQRAIQIVLNLREYAVQLLPGFSSRPDTVSNIFEFSFAVLPPKGGSEDIAYMLRKASESAILVKFKELVLSSQAMKDQVQVSDGWLLVMPIPEVKEETVRRPVSFETWTSTPEPLPYIPRITTTEAHTNPQDCATITSPCECAGVSACEWAKINDQYRCQRGNGRVPCTACDSQQECQALTCGGLTSACLCAFSPLKCHWDSTKGSCFEGDGTTRCSACARQSHCRPPEIVSFVPAAGTQLTLPQHKDLQIDFDRTVTVKETGTTSFTCSEQPLPFYVPWSDIQLSLTGKGIRISISVLLKSNFKSTRECTLEIGYGVVVDNDDVPFTGLEKGLYSFSLGDTVQPNVRSYTPPNGASDVVPGSSVTFAFDEDIKVVSQKGVIVLYETSDDSSASLFEGAVASFQMSSPTVAVKDREIIVDLSQLTKGDFEYSLGLPNDAIADTSGNLFPGIPAGFYTFRTRSTHVIESGVLPGFEENYPLILAGGGGLLVALGALITWRLCRLKSHAKARSIYPETLPSHEKEHLDFDGSGTTLSFDQTEADNSSTRDSSGRNWAQKVRSAESPKAQWQSAYVKASIAKNGLAGAGSAAATLGRKSAGGNNTARPTTPSGSIPTIGEFQSKAYSKRSASSYSNLGSGTRENPSNSGNHSHQSGQSRHSSSSAKTPTNNTDSATDFSADSAEVKEKKMVVERKLRDLMDKPLAERKKVLRQMILEYHPDKSSDEHAKEVFQFINASRAWFLAEA
ncbi:Hypothetical protein (Fragment) [Durusdinium trenchii]|uniref:SbsA Ig-like domain-containing protein n=1 Tax=Durusdinium trenchii TaxID=1381693 RepID=A0ABP0IUD9_9DINO